MSTEPANRLLGMTVLGDFLVSEGVDAVLENLQRVGATAVACNPTVTAAATAESGSWQPPSDAGHSGRTFDRPLFGQGALWVRSGPSFHPRRELYRDCPYGPRRTNDLTDQYGALVGQFIDRAVSAGLEVYLQIGAAQPSGLRDEDRPRLPDRRLPAGRVADTASLASDAVRAYNQAYLRDLAAQYPSITGFRVDWPEYPCYTPDEVLQDFSPHVERWAQRNGFDFHEIRSGMQQFTRELCQSLTDDDLRQVIAEPQRRGRLRSFLAERFPVIQRWLDLKRGLSLDLIGNWKQIVADLPGEPKKKLSLHAFPPPFSDLTGFDFARSAALCDSLSPKLYTMHWCLMIEQWGQALLASQPQLDESLLIAALVHLLDVGHEEGDEEIDTEHDERAPRRRLVDYAYPAPDQPHPIDAASQARKIMATAADCENQTAVYPLVHAYGPRDDFAKRFRIAWQSEVQGVWINRYGYVSDAKLDVLRHRGK